MTEKTVTYADADEAERDRLLAAVRDLLGEYVRADGSIHSVQLSTWMDAEPKWKRRIALAATDTQKETK